MNRSSRRQLTEKFLADVWEVCDLYGASVTGGCRTPTRNRDKGGVENSRHLFEFGWGLACDLSFDFSNDRDLAVKDLHRMGWYTYIGPGYGVLRLHVQAFKKGDPLPEETA